MDISNAVDVAKQRFGENNLSGEFIQTDLNNLPFDSPLFDVIFSEGVLHHTNSTQKAIENLSKLIVPCGYFMFYVYLKKGPIREFTDDYIREKIKSLNDEDAWATLRSLTKLGIALGELNAQIDVQEPIEYLGIPAGKIDVQRLFYWYFCKAFYRPDYNIEEMNHINFDWYRPHNCHRQTEEEVLAWCRDAGLLVVHKNIQESGITIIAQKKI